MNSKIYNELIKDGICPECYENGDQKLEYFDHNEIFCPLCKTVYNYNTEVENE
jgi:hypothetical protein